MSHRAMSTPLMAPTDAPADPMYVRWRAILVHSGPMRRGSSPRRSVSNSASAPSTVRPPGKLVASPDARDAGVGLHGHQDPRPFQRAGDAMAADGRNLHGANQAVPGLRCARATSSRRDTPSPGASGTPMYPSRITPSPSTRSSHQGIVRAWYSSTRQFGTAAIT